MVSIFSSIESIYNLSNNPFSFASSNVVSNKLDISSLISGKFIIIFLIVDD